MRAQSYSKSANKQTLSITISKFPQKKIPRTESCGEPFNILSMKMSYSSVFGACSFGSIEASAFAAAADL